MVEEEETEEESNWIKEEEEEELERLNGLEMIRQKRENLGCRLKMFSSIPWLRVVIPTLAKTSA